MNFSLRDLSRSKKRRLAAAAFLIFVVLLGIFTFLLFNKLHSITVNTPKSEVSDEPEYVAADIFGVMFVLREYSGKVAVLNSLESQVLEILDIPADSLPESFRAELDGGICITSVTELVSVISSFENDTSLS